MDERVLAFVMSALAAAIGLYIVGVALIYLWAALDRRRAGRWTREQIEKADAECAQMRTHPNYVVFDRYGGTVIRKSKERNSCPKT